MAKRRARTADEAQQEQFDTMRKEAGAAFPEAFPAANGADRRPLALGAYTALRAASLGWSARRTGWFLAHWTKRPRYLKAVAEAGSRRINLDGTDAGEVEAGHREHALASLAARRSRRAREALASVVTTQTGDAPDLPPAACGQRDRADSEAPARSGVVAAAPPPG